ncbi:hypothetical protein CRYUN_Cryun18bG0043500 [Craigia yunnanensis]
MVAQLEHQQQQEEPCLDNLQKAKSLICALNFVSRNLPLPPHLFDVVSSICYDEQEGLREAINDGTQVEAGSDVAGAAQMGSDDPSNSKKDDLLHDLDDALSKQRSKCMSGFGLVESTENRYQSHIHHQLNELEDLPSRRGEDLQTKCLLELYGLKRLSRLREEERNHLENRKKKFFSEIVNAFRDFQLQIQATLKRQKQRNDGVQAWHGRQRQCATRAEKLRFQALKADVKKPI